MSNRPSLRLVSAQPKSITDHLQELRLHVGASSLLIEVLTQELDKAKAALAALEGVAA